MRDCGGTNEISRRRNITRVGAVRTLTCVAAALALVGGGVACDRGDAPLAAPELPVVHITSERPGPTLALVAGVHGGKVSAVRALEQLAVELPSILHAGTVLLVGPANLAGYRAGLAQTSPDDGLNLNRVFPGRVDGSSTERLAARIVAEIVAKSDYLVDMHGSDGEEAVGRFAYAARPGIHPRTDSLALGLALGWGVPLVVWDDDGPRELAESRFLQTAAHLSGVPAITVFEAGATREESVATAAFIVGAYRVLAQLGMLERGGSQAETPASAQPGAQPGAQTVAQIATPPVIAPRRFVRLADSPGEWAPAVRPATQVTPGELLGTLRDSSGVTHEVRASASGLVLHLRLAGTVPAGAPLVILAATQLPSSAP
jgi:predicted deacylase